MSTWTKKQWAFLLGFIALFFVIFFLPKTPGSKEAVQKAESTNSLLTFYVDSIKSNFEPSRKPEIEKNEEFFRSNADSIISFWNRNGEPAVAGYYLSELAEDKNSKDVWVKAGNSFFLATRMNIPKYRQEFYEKAILSYENALKLDSSDADIRTRLGVCYVEGTAQPMKGITLLRDVVKEDSTNVDAQLNLGLFAVQSKQYDKAIARFETIARVRPDFAEAYLYLGQTYAGMGENEKAVKALEKFSSMTNDSLVRSEVEKYVRELKNS